MVDAQLRYPVIEFYGYVWIWFGRPEAADIAHMPNLPFLPPKGGLPRFMLGTVRFDCAAPISLENLIDLTHADFLHADVIGDEKSESETRSEERSVGKEGVSTGRSRWSP